MHSSRMHTGCSLTICRGASFQGGSPWQGGASSQGVSLAWGCLLPRGGLLGRGVPPWQGGLLEAEPPPPVDGITDTSKNITLATTSLRPVKRGNPAVSGPMFLLGGSP